MKKKTMIQIKIFITRWFRLPLAVFLRIFPWIAGHLLLKVLMMRVLRMVMITRAAQ